jgi:formate dehydrogenase maturation protein FdhE
VVLRTLDASRANAMEALCELIVPGSSRVGPVVYVDALLTEMPPPVREGALAAIDALAPAAEQGAEALAEHVFTPEFGLVRALAIEAYYSDFVAPDKDGPGAWAEIDFNSPLATRLSKDWSYLGIA